MAEREQVIITGTTGRIGAELAERLASRFQVLAFDREPERSARAASAAYAVDVTDAASVQKAVGEVRDRFGARVASVVHLSAYYSFSGEPDPQHEAVNVRGTQCLLHALQSLEVEQFLFASTMNVHSPCQPGERIDETWPLDRKQEWQYPRSKAEAEDLLRAEHGAVPLVVLRIASVYEEWCRHPVLARQMQRIYERSLLGHFFPGDPEHGLTYLHLEDLLDALVRAIDRRAELPPETVLLVGEAEPVSYGALQEGLGRLLLGEEWSTYPVPPPLAKAGAWVQDHLPGGDPFIKPWMINHADEHYALDTGQARRWLEWEPRRTLLEMLPTLVERLQTEPERWYRENDLEAEGKPQAA